MKKLTKKETESKIKFIKNSIIFEKERGVHTYHLCACGENSCRSLKCVVCWEKELKKYNKLLGKRSV